ncbi:putative RING-H2 finger protein ATL21A [Momordica charantia]|uniref:RING-H2 finger protein ATL21A n=1 Tax=Momordica charantia TaxID=3673 RepID=A0A6J1D2K0_MOMCH|nr:putative RING-H2 finger protein ATL21A [Momordica charantia]
MGFSHIFLFLSILPSLSTAESCSTSKCINDKFSIRFPFRIPEQQPARCGYPGFNLACNKAGITTLNLYSSGQFYVRDIDYATQQIQLYDPEACLPRKLLEGFKISDSPFMPLFSQNFTFLSCPSQFAISRFPVLGCLSNSTNSVVATSSMSFVKSMSTACKIIATLPVPVSRPDEAEGFSSNLNGDLVLTWYSPACGICESEGRLCGYKNSNGQGITCYNYTTEENNALRVFRIICVVIVLPTLMCVFGLGCFICFAKWGYGLADGRGNQVQHRQQVNPAGADLEAEPPTRLSGLDESTIESYEKVILGESRRLPGPNGITCPICLGEYLSKDTVRCIPECKHCFHVDCIDQWLRVNSSCPLCRNSPSPSPSHLTPFV